MASRKSTAPTNAATPADVPVPGADDKPPNADATPTSEAPKRPRGRPRKPDAEKARKEASRQLESALAEILTMPSLGFAMVGDEFCADHFAEQGPRFAKRLVEVSERHEQVRVILERMVMGETVAVLLLDGFAYLMPPLIHHGLPAPPGLRRMMGVPDPLPSPNGNTPFSEPDQGFEDPADAEAATA